jgi:uncharacterized protein
MMDKDSIVRVIADQRALYFKPDDLKRVDPLPSDKEIVVISGIRRCGKSTYLHELRDKNQAEPDYYMNFDDERLLKFTVEDFQTLHETFIELYSNQEVFYFDEIQNIEGWERFVRRLYDHGYKVFISGSNASMLSRELGTHLTGRYYQIELFPFSFPEYLKLLGHNFPKNTIISTQQRARLKAAFNEYFVKGGFPAYLKSGNKQYLKSLYESILYRDVMVRNGLTNEKELLELVHFLASNTSRLFSYNSLAKVIGVRNATTVKNYLNFLQNTYLIFMVNKYDASLKTQLHNPKKGYFIDIGLVREIGFFNSQDNGRLLENLVFIELKRRAKEVYYHSGKKECDFVIREKNRIVEAIQVCWSVYDSDTRKREINGLIEALDCYGLDEGLILTDSEEDLLELDGYRITIKPVWKWLLFRE